MFCSCCQTWGIETSDVHSAEVLPRSDNVGSSRATEHLGIDCSHSLAKKANRRD